MFEFLRPTKRYKKIRIDCVKYSRPRTISFPQERTMRFSEIISESMYDNGYESCVRISDGDVEGSDRCMKGEENEVLTSKYGYCIDCFGEYFFFNSVTDCLKKFIDKQEERILARHRTMGITNAHLAWNRSVFDSFTTEPKIEINVMEKRSKLNIINSLDDRPIIMDNFGMGIPIFFGDDILSDDRFLFFYKSEPIVPFFRGFPEISYGAFYVDLNNKIKRRYAKQLFRPDYLEMMVADVEKEKSYILHFKNHNSYSFYSSWKEAFIYKEDIKQYSSYKDYQSQNISLTRDRKLNEILSD